MKVTNTHLYIHHRQCPHSINGISKREIMGFQKPLVRKVIVRRKPLNSTRPSLVKNINNTKETKGSLVVRSETMQTTQPKKQRVVIFKYRLTNRNHTDNTFKSQSTTSSITESRNDTYEHSERLLILPTQTFSSKLTSSSSISMRPRSRKQKKLRINAHELTMLSTAANEETLHLTTTTTVLYTRTYTYIVERVHNDQTEQLQSISTFIRVNTRHLPVTLSITRTDFNNLTVKPTQKDPK